jgi:hypothetical protein
MVTIEVAAKVTLDDLVQAVEQLPPSEMIELVRRVLAIQAKQGVSLLEDEEESVLFAVVKGKQLTPVKQKRLDDLRNKNREGMLTPTEQAELLDFVRQVEGQDLLRVEALVKLAQKRNMTVSALMDKLGLEPVYA